VAIAPPVAVSNTLLARLPGKEREQCLSLCEPFEMQAGTTLCAADGPYGHAYFPASGLISMVSVLHDRKPMEIALIDHQGMLGASLVLGIDTAPMQAVVHTSGVALRIAVANLRRQVAASLVLRKLLSHYLYLQLVELSLVGGCIRNHRIEQRLARALLLADDRARDDHIHLTHSHLADMLGVRRSGITIAAGHMQDHRLLRYTRGTITILDRPGLEAMSCECYRVLLARQGRR
jgi:CRP-like cAMP-binding protein